MASTNQPRCDLALDSNPIELLISV
jgi:hypothetical protein